jgi:polysaccharide export outer membrane protein
MHRSFVPTSIYLAFVVLALAARVSSTETTVSGQTSIPLPNGATVPAKTNEPPELQEYLRQLAARLTNSAPAPGNSVPSNSVVSSLISTNAALQLDQLDDLHKLALGDRVSYRVVEDKEDPKELFVTDSGELEIPNLGRVSALGKTCLQLASQIKAVLEKKYYYQATVVLSVDIINKTRGRVYLAGRVKIPGYLDIPADEVFTVSKAILRAGGFGDFADQRHVKVTRKGAPGGEVVTVDVVKVLEKGQASQDVELEPDDRVFVPSKLYNF